MNKTKEQIDRAKLYQAKYRLEHPQIYDPTKNPIQIYYRLRQHSKHREMDFMLNQQDFIEWYKQKEKVCFYCDITELDTKKYLGNRLTIERFDNSLGYILENMGLACSWCNKIRSNILTVEETRQIGQSIIKLKYKHLFKI